MNKRELIQALQEEQNLSKSEATQIVELVFGAMADALAKGNRIDIRGLCAFQVKSYKPFTGRDPRSGETVVVKAKKLPCFKAGADLRRRVDVKK
jgi:integration host factor subunit beta